MVNLFRIDRLALFRMKISEYVPKKYLKPDSIPLIPEVIIRVSEEISAMRIISSNSIIVLSLCFSINGQFYP